MFKPDKTKFKDEKGRYIVQGLFLEDQYNTNLSVYTLAGEDKEYKGHVYPSLKRLYLEEGDVVEYQFATKYLYDWPHWQRLCKNAIVGRHIAEWREELELSLRSEGLLTMITLASEKDSYQAAKYLLDKGWVERERGRPSEAEIEGKLKERAKLVSIHGDELSLLKKHKEAKDG